MNVATNKFLNNLLACQRIKANPVLWQHFNAENKNLGVKNLTEDNKIKAQCHYCYTTKQPKLIVKRLKKQRGKEVKRKSLFFCSLCGIKMKQLCGQMPQRKVVKIEIESCPVLQKIETSTVKESKSAKKKKKKDVNAGLIVPQSLVKPASTSTSGAKSFAKNPHLLKMLSNAAAAESANQDKLKQFLK